MEEVQDILLRLGAGFHHILRKVNELADRLAREGIFRSLFLLMYSFF